VRHRGSYRHPPTKKQAETVHSGSILVADVEASVDSSGIFLLDIEFQGDLF